MKSLQDTDKLIADFNKPFFSKLEKIKTNRREQLKMAEENIKRKGDEALAMLAGAGIDKNQLAHLKEMNQKHIHHFLDRVRPGLIDRKIDLSAIQKNKAVYLNSVHQSNARIVAPYTVLQQSANPPAPPPPPAIQQVDGGGWVPPDDPSRILLADQEGGNSGVWGIAHVYRPGDTGVVMFTFIPDQTGLWNLMALFDFHGFFIMRSFDSWYDSNHASVKVTASISVFQYAEQGVKEFDVLNLYNQNIDDNFQLFDSANIFDTSASLRAGDPVVVRVVIHVLVDTAGDDSFAEINFKDGSANFIEPEVLVANFAG